MTFCFHNPNTTGDFVYASLGYEKVKNNFNIKKYIGDSKND